MICLFRRRHTRAATVSGFHISEPEQGARRDHALSHSVPRRHSSGRRPISLDPSSDTRGFQIVYTFKLYRRRHQLTRTVTCTVTRYRVRLLCRCAVKYHDIFPQTVWRFRVQCRTDLLRRGRIAHHSVRCCDVILCTTIAVYYGYFAN